MKRPLLALPRVGGRFVMRSYFVDKYCREREAKGIMGTSPKKKPTGQAKALRLPGLNRLSKRNDKEHEEMRKQYHWGMNFARGFTKTFIESSVALSYFPVDRVAKLAAIDFL